MNEHKHGDSDPVGGGAGGGPGEGVAADVPVSMSAGDALALIDMLKKPPLPGWVDRVHCCMCPEPPASLVGGNLLCEAHLEDAAMEAAVEAAEGQDEPEEKRVHNPFDDGCAKHVHGVHPVRFGAHCEVCCDAD